VRIYCPRFWFWTDILRPLVSFLSPLQEVGILYVCLCLVIFLSNSVLYCTDVLVHSLCMALTLSRTSFLRCSVSSAILWREFRMPALILECSRMRLCPRRVHVYLHVSIPIAWKLEIPFETAESPSRTTLILIHPITRYRILKPASRWKHATSTSRVDRVYVIYARYRTGDTFLSAPAVRSRAS